MGHLAARLNLLNKAVQRTRYAAFLKQLNLPIGTLVVENSLSEFCSKLLLLAARPEIAAAQEKQETSRVAIGPGEPVHTRPGIVAMAKSLDSELSTSQPTF